MRIFTPDKAQLRAHITRSGDRALALDLEVSKRERRAIRIGNLRALRRGRAFAKALCMIVARRFQFTESRKESVAV